MKCTSSGELKGYRHHIFREKSSYSAYISHYEMRGKILIIYRGIKGAPYYLVPFEILIGLDLRSGEK